MAITPVFQTGDRGSIPLTRLKILLKFLSEARPKGGPLIILIKKTSVQYGCFFYICGVCLKKSEPILRRTPTNEDAPPPPRGHQRKMFLAFRICARPISSKKERTFFFGVLSSKYSGRWRGDNSIRSGMAEFPPHPPSAMPSLGRTDFSAAASMYL